MQMPPDARDHEDPVLVAVVEDEGTGEPRAVVHAHLDDGHVADLIFDLDTFSAFAGEVSRALLRLRAIDAAWFLVDGPEPGEGAHLVGAAAFAGRGRRLPALCGRRLARDDRRAVEPLDRGADPCPECTCPACLRRWGEVAAREDKLAADTVPARVPEGAARA